MEDVLRIVADSGPLISKLRELRDLLLEPEAFYGLPNLSEFGLKAGCIDVEPILTSGTGDLRVTFKPTDFLLNLVSALRARVSILESAE